jgi:hypothetical protein
MRLPKHPSALNRRLDPRYPSNLMIMTFTPLVGLVMFLIGLAQGENLLGSLILGVNAAGAVGIAWVLTRELDPDYSPSAMIAAVVTLLVILWAEIAWSEVTVNFVALVLLIWLSRMVGRSTGIPYTVLDGLLILALAAYLATTPLWILGIPTGLCFLADSFLNKPHRLSLPFGVLTLIAMPLIAAYDDRLDQLDFALETGEIIVIGLLVLSSEMVNALTPLQLESEGDYSHEPLNRRRVLMMRRLMLLGVVLAAMGLPDGGVEKLLPMWVGFVVFIPLTLARRVM